MRETLKLAGGFGEMFERGLARDARVHMLHECCMLGVDQLFFEQLLKFLQGGARLHGGSSFRPSSLVTSADNIFWTRLLATNTCATCMGMRWAASAPDKPSRAVRRKASQVCGATRKRTRAIASS